MPYSGPASAYGVDRPRQAAYFKMINEQGGINGRKINSSASTTATARPRRSSRPAASSSRRGGADLQRARHAPQCGDPEISQREEGAAALRRHRREQVRRSREFPLDHRLAAQLPDRGAHLRQDILATKPDAKIGVLYQNDDFGKDYLNGLKDGLGAKYAAMVIKRRPTRSPIRRSTARSSTCRAPAPTCVHHRGDAEIRRPDDPQGR